MTLVSPFRRHYQLCSTRRSVSSHQHYGDQRAVRRPSESGKPYTYYEYRDSLSSVIGRHLLRYGGEFRNIFIALSVGAPKAGSFSFNSLLAFAADSPYYQSLVVDPSTDIRLRFNTTIHPMKLGYFFRDDWKATSRLTINAGCGGLLGGQASVMENSLHYLWTRNDL